MDRISGNYGMNYGGSGMFGSPATARAMQQMMQATAGEAQANPDAAQMGRGAFLGGMQQGPARSRQEMALQMGSTQLPPDWQTMPLDQFLAAAARARRNMPGPAPRPNGQGGHGNQGGSAPLHVSAHSRQDSEGNAVPVRSVVVNETGNWSSREETDNPAHYNKLDANYRRAQLGKTYTVTTTWEDGRTQTDRVTDKGYPVDIW